ncbi:hypothetical protein [Endozoicomonas arenosclerae]|uniref:hypothetical protein n=1 Tax=Endozoicomonas arenosclerae TaxID=1633495 RepID=UPI00078075C4|nr:hypothetical protein [Endozoicomonas arenosclerae]
MFSFTNAEQEGFLPFSNTVTYFGTGNLKPISKAFKAVTRNADALATLSDTYPDIQASNIPLVGSIDVETGIYMNGQDSKCVYQVNNVSNTNIKTVEDFIQLSPIVQAMKLQVPTTRVMRFQEKMRLARQSSYAMEISMIRGYRQASEAILSAINESNSEKDFYYSAGKALLSAVAAAAVIATAGAAIPAIAGAIGVPSLALTLYGTELSEYKTEATIKSFVGTIINAVVSANLTSTTDVGLRLVYEKMEISELLKDVLYGFFESEIDNRVATTRDSVYLAALAYQFKYAPGNQVSPTPINTTNADRCLSDLYTCLKNNLVANPINEKAYQVLNMPEFAQLIKKLTCLSYAAEASISGKTTLQSHILQNAGMINHKKSLFEKVTFKKQKAPVTYSRQGALGGSQLDILTLLNSPLTSEQKANMRSYVIKLNSNMQTTETTLSSNDLNTLKTLKGAGIAAKISEILIALFQGANQTYEPNNNQN